MNTKKTVAHLLLAAMMSVVLHGKEGIAADGTARLPKAIPVTGMKGNPDDHSRVTGLAFAVEDAGWPTLSILSADVGSPVIGALAGSTVKPGHLKPVPILLGCMKIGNRGQLKGQQANAVSNTIVYGNDAGELSLTVSRLSPAVLLETKSGTVELFGREEKPVHPVPLKTTPASPGTVKPLRWAAPAADGKVLTGVLRRQEVCELPFQAWGQRVDRAESLAPEQVSAPPLAQLGKGWLLLWYGSDSPFVSSKVPFSILPRVLFPGQLGMKTILQADVPLLLVFENAPKAVELKKEGDAARFLISFDGQAGKIAMLPLFGHDLRPAAETERWLKAFPAGVKERCDFWAGCLAEFPVNVKESVAYNEKQDRVTLTETFDYVRVREGGKRIAPLPAMLALGFSQGLKVRFSEEPTDLKLATQFGPVMGIRGESYTWSMGGLGKAVHARRAIGPASPKAAELEKELVAEVDKMIEAGHLAPWICFMRRFGFIAFRDPSEALYLLSEVLPVLPPDRQEKLRAYMKAECKSYPPHQVKSIDLDDGVRREVRKLAVKSKKYGSMGYKTGSTGSPTYVNEPHPPLYRANGVARYYRAMGEEPSPEVVGIWMRAMAESLKATDWATMAWFWGKYDRIQVYSYPGKRVKPAQLAAYLRRGYFANTMRHVHRDAAGLIGYLQLCRSAGKAGEPETWGQLARLTALRFSLARYGRYLAASGISQMPKDPDVRALLARSGDLSKPENHLQQPLCINQHGIIIHATVSRELSQYQYTRRGNYGGLPSHEIVFLDMTPEFGKLLAEFGFDDDARRFLEFFEKVQPTWHAAYTDCMHRSGSELAYMFPTDAHQLFVAHAWIAGTPPEKLERYIDQPWTPLGDLYYMHKLAETIKAYRGVKWAADEE